jgi:hypothetical protein
VVNGGQYPLPVGHLWLFHGNVPFVASFFVPAGVLLKPPWLFINIPHFRPFVWLFGKMPHKFILHVLPIGHYASLQGAWAWFVWRGLLSRILVWKGYRATAGKKF